jgi:hypothetical protein
MLSRLALTIILAGPFISIPFALSQSNDPGGAQLKPPVVSAPTEVASAEAPSASVPKSVVSKHSKKKKKAKAASAKTS